MKLIAYNCSPTSDEKTARLRKAVEEAGGKWKEATQMSEHELAATVREDGVDVLVELTGHTANNRLGVMAQRPAPIQVKRVLLGIFFLSYFLPVLGANKRVHSRSDGCPTTVCSSHESSRTSCAG